MISRYPKIFSGIFFILIFFSCHYYSFAQENKSDKNGSYTPNLGFKIANTDKGDVNFKIFTYIRYLNQLSLDSGYTDSFGNQSAIDRRQDVQLNKVNLQFLGWFMDPKFRYVFYVWTNNTAQGQGAQVVVGGCLNYNFNKYFTLGGGIGALPGVRTTEGTFPNWLSVDNRNIADEFFRPSYTTGFWATGLITEGVKYNVMIGNNLSQLGVDAGQLDDKFNTVSGELVWFPTTGEYGFNSCYADFENHQKIATRIAVHFTRSDEDKQGQPTTDAFENVTIRISDGTPIFKSNVYGANVQIATATYNMTCIDGGFKYKGFSLDGEYYKRVVNNVTGPGTDTISKKEFNDNGFQLQASSMIIKEKLLLYVSTSKVFGEYGNPSDYRGGITWFPWKSRSFLCNLEYIKLEKSPVGGLSLPFPVGGNGGVIYSNFVVNF